MQIQHCSFEMRGPPIKNVITIFPENMKYSPQAHIPCIFPSGNQLSVLEGSTTQL